MIGDYLINRYKIMMHIGTGGMATVYKAKDTVLNRYVAIKVLLPQFSQDEEFIKRFRREAQAAASLSHANVVSIYDVGQDNNNHFIVMEFVEGKSLKEIILQKSPLAINKAADFACQISDALKHAHDNNVIHRDIKPHNILITTDGKAKVTDFGIARAVSEATQTYTRSVIGSAHYFSPEQAKGSHTSESSDIYSLGIVLYEMLTGSVPFNGDNPVSVALKHIQETPVNPSAYNSKIPADMDSVVMKALEKDQTLRYQGVNEFVGDLCQFTFEPSKFSHLLNSKLDGETISSTGQFLHLEDSPTREIPVVGQTANTDNSVGTRADNLEGSKVTNKKRPKKSKPKISLKKSLIALVIIGVMVGGLFWGINQIAAFLLVPEVTVPDVEGKSLEEAQNLLNEEGLDSSVSDREHHPEIEATYVITQDPSAERSVRQNRSIDLVISEGPESLTTPDISGLRRREAEIELEQAGFEVEVEEEYDETEAGEVISQDPSPETELEEGDLVVITVSEGEEPFDMPNLVGEEKEDILDELDDQDLELRNEYEEEDPTLPPEVITSQWPEADEEVQPEDSVDIWLNKVEEEELDEDLERHTIELGDLPTDEEILIRISDELGSTEVFEGEPEEENMEIQGTEEGYVEIYVKDEDGNFSQLLDIISFPE